MNHGLRVLQPSKKVISHLLLAGHVPLTSPARSSPTLTPAPLSSWLSSVGRATDVQQGYSILENGLSSGLAHNLIAYRSDGVDRLFSVGRNETAQLGLGYNSQVETRGLVEGFEGDAVLAVEAHCQSSYLLVREEQDSTAVYGFGSLQRGRLGQPAFCSPEDDSDLSKEPELHMLAKATKIPSPVRDVKSIVGGFEHFLLLSHDGEVYGTGCNTDGQLGLGLENVVDAFELSKIPIPNNERVLSIHAGADTTGFMTESGALWTMGNSEYSQALHGRPIDQIMSPTHVDLSFLPLSRELQDFVCGGSFSLLLDNKGSVYSAGFGALALGKTLVNSPAIRRIDALEGQGISRIRAKWGYAAAIRDAGTQSTLFTWGVNTPSGRLGIPAPSSLSSTSSSTKSGPPSLVYEPTEVSLPLQQLGLGEEGQWELGEVALGSETLWVDLREEDGMVE